VVTEPHGNGSTRCSILTWEVTRQRQDYGTGNTELNTILLADGRARFTESQHDLQSQVNGLGSLKNGFNVGISTTKTRTTAFQGENHSRCKTATDRATIRYKDLIISVLIYHTAWKKL
jgi:hypothetical protein